MLRLCLMLLALVAVISAEAAERRAAEILWRGTERFTDATSANTMSTAVRRPGKVAEVPLPAIFLHPQGTDRSLLEFPPLQAKLPVDSRVFLLSQVGMSDGFDWKDEKAPPDGARFYLQAGGQDLATYYVQEAGWVPLAAALPVEAGQLRAVLTLGTDSGPKGNSSYDWAMFGDPLVVSLPGQALAAGAAVSGPAGVLVVEKAPGKVTVEGLDAAGQPLPGLTATVTPQADMPLTFLRFDFSQEPKCLAWRWQADGGTAAAWGGSWQPQLQIESLALSKNAVTVVGEQRTARVTLKNLGLGAVCPEHEAVVTLGNQTRKLAQLAPEATTGFDMDLGPAGAGATPVTATVAWITDAGKATDTEEATQLAWTPLPKLPAEQPRATEARDLGGGYLLLQNPQSQWVINTQTPGLGALVYAWVDGKWEAVGSVAPFLQIVAEDGQEVAPTLKLTKFGAPAVVANGEASGLQCSVTLALRPDRGLTVIAEVAAAQDTRVRAVRGPAVHVGDRGTGSKKGVAMFPGLEYLEGEEVSSSDRDLAPPLSNRRVPHMFKVCMPMLAVETRPKGPVVALVWDARQKWDGQQMAPGACFASPDFITGYDSHLMQLQLPRTPDGILENERVAQEPVTIKPGQPWRLTQHVVARQPEQDATEALLWYDKLVGYPAAEAAPRSFDEEMALCRHGFMVTAWDEETRKGRHVVGWAPANSPAHATLLLMDARTVAPAAEKQKLLDRVDLVGNQTIEQQGARGLASRANAHIMGWEFPYHWGSLPGALDGMREQAEGLMKGQEENGGWGYYPSKDREKLGKPGTQTMGTVGGPACWIARWAAISGDPKALASMKKAMDLMRGMQVPRGAQGWECPILEPDVLASAYALRAAVWAYMATNDPQYLEDARFYARTGLPFQYVWDDGKHPGMRYASIPVFGSTFFTHSWIGLPVQWCGLVYAYGLVELMRFDQNDLWQRQVEGMTVSGMHQQWPMDNKELAGSYPDSFGQWFTVRNGVYINPENIQLNLMALKQLDPGLRSVAAKLGGKTVHVTAPCDVQAKAEGAALRISAKYLPNEIVYLTLAGTGVAAVTANGEALKQSEDLPHGSVGWVGRPDFGVIVGGKCNAQGVLEVVVR